MSGRHAHAEARRLLRQALLDPGVLPTLPPAELELTLRAARRARLLGHLATRLEDRGRGELSRLPAEAADILISASVLAEATCRQALWEVDRVFSALSAAPPTPLVVLKGCAYALAALPNRRGRYFVDADLLVRESELASTEAKLLAADYRFRDVTAYDEHYYRAWTHELPPLSHPSREVEVDLHHNILQRTARFKVDAARLLADIRPIPGTPFARLGDTDIVIHAAVHLFCDSELTDRLRDLVDIDVLIRHFSADDPAYCEALVRRAAELGLTRPMFYALRYATKMLGTPVPPAALALADAGRPSRWLLGLMDTLVESALFPEHPDLPSVPARLARFALFLRSHWIRMPPLLLARHLSYKTWLALRSFFEPAEREAAAEGNPVR